MKVKYDLEMKARFAGTIEMSEKQFKKLDAIQDEEKLVSEIFELIDNHDIMDFSPDNLFEFEPAEEEQS